MRIRSLEAIHFRNHVATELEFAPHVNLLSGPNGAGKTNLIDAVHYLCISRSFVTTSDAYVVHMEADGFAITGWFEGRIRSGFQVRYQYRRGEGKRIFVNDSPLERIADLIGMVPVVVLSPEDRKLTQEGPAERRSFLDALISQVSSTYLQDLVDYRKVVRQRNRLLSMEQHDRRTLKAWLEPWDRQLVDCGSRILAKRQEMLRELHSYLQQSYGEIAGVNHQPDFRYASFHKELDHDAGTIAGQFAHHLEQAFERECQRQQTLIGPHRDDLVFYLNGMPLRRYGSQGQHRMFALALKIAQLHFFSDRLEDLPVFLLDDVFGDLDPQKIEIFVHLLDRHDGQTFVTAANPGLITPHLSFDSEKNAHFQVSEGSVRAV